MENKYKVNTWANYDHEKQQYEENNQKSLTIPDQAMSIKEILNRFARGLDVEGFKPVYDDDDITLDDYLPNPQTMDLAEREEYTQQLQAELTELRNQFNKTERISFAETEDDPIQTDSTPPKQ